MRLLTLLLALIALTTAAAAKVTSPREHFGFAIGDDYQLATYTQTEAYFKRLAAESPRVRLVDMGRTEEGRTQWMLVLSSPANLARLEHFRDISSRLARAEGLAPAAAEALAAEGRAVVWIDGGLHASETVGTHQLIETAWVLASAGDPEMLRILDQTIVLLAHANPDGQELVSSWYMREPDPAKRVLTPTPRLYQKYIGHDNNRDFFLSAMRETTNINRQLYLEWFPQVVYNHHQTGPAGTVIFIPPFRDPFNHVLDPMVIVGVETLGNAIQTRFLQEGKPGATSRSGATYSTWFNGGLRTTAYFHNQIGLLSEIIGNPTPMRIPLVLRRQLPHNDLPAPVAPQEWHYRQSIDYSLSANRAVLDHAARHREVLLMNTYRMGRNAIERGSRDHWTPRPSRLDAVARLAAKEQGGAAEAEDSPEAGEGRATPGLVAAKYWDVLRKPEWRDPRGFILPADQPDFPTAVKFVNALLKTGVLVHRATAAFTVGGRTYPSGSYVVRCDQAFRAHVLDLFEPQDHPQDFKYEGGPPNRPYDVAGWTLAFQMGVQFDRILEGFDGPFERLPYGALQPPPPRVLAPAPSGHLASHRVNDTMILANRLARAGVEAWWLREAPPGRPDFGPGALWIPASPAAGPILARATRELGLELLPLAAAPTGGKLRLGRPRVALWDRFGGSMPSGWTRWILEQFEFDFEVVYPEQIDAGGLRAKYDVIVFPSGAIAPPGMRPVAVARPRNLPREYEGWLGRISAEKSVPALREFLAAGGSIVTIGSSTSLAQHLGLPVRNALREAGADGRERPLPEEKFYIPGSILEARVDPAQPVAWGLPERLLVYFERSPAFTITDPAAVRPVAWFDSATPLRSGWAWGERVLKDTTTAATIPVGPGTVHLFASEVAFRGQTHGSLKLLFNALHLSAAER